MPLSFQQLSLPASPSVCVLAPHPDDFDAVSVSLRWLHEREAVIHLAVLTTGASGVEDGYRGVNSPSEKAALREAEQLASCTFFGLPSERISFLRLPLEAKDDAPADAASHAVLSDYLLARKPQLVFMPHGNDSNAAHKRSYALFAQIARETKLEVLACLNQDAKTIAMRHDLVMPFGAESAAWKAELLRFHVSQQQRNLNTRGHGFDERVLQINHQGALNLGLSEPYVEVFELERFSSVAA